MKNIAHFQQWFLLAALGSSFQISANALSAATLYSVTYGAGGPITKEADTYYNQTSGLDNGQWDQISTIFRAPVTTTDSLYSLKSSLYGRYYDADPTKPGETGLLDRETLTGFNDPAWLVKHGLPPSSVGSLKSGTLVNGSIFEANASYLAFTIGMVSTANGEKVLFDGANLSITGFYNIDSDVQIWGATNSDGFGSAVIPTITQPVGTDTDVYTFDFSNVNFTGTELEIRVYGVLGQDQGTFTSALAAGKITPPPNIPEPSGVILLGFAAVAGCFRRRRKA